MHTISISHKVHRRKWAPARPATSSAGPRPTPTRPSTARSPGTWPTRRRTRTPTSPPTTAPWRRASRSAGHRLLDPLRPAGAPGRRVERLGVVAGLLPDLAVAELDPADAVGDRAVGVLDVRLAHPDVAAAGQAAQLDVRLPAREGLLEPAEAVTVHPLARLRELHREVLVAGLVLHRRVHGVDYPVHQLAHLVLLHGCPP